MSNFYVNWDLLVHRLLPSFMRFSMMELWLRVCVSPLAYTYLNLFTFRVNSKDLAAQNSQTIVLQTILRKQFNNNIEVVNNDNLIYLTRLYREQVGIEEPAVYRTKHNKFEPLLFRQEHINEINPYGFTVHLYGADEKKVKAVINRLKISSISYNVIL